MTVVFAVVMLCFLFAALAIKLVVWWHSLTIGTKSVLFGAHCFFLHPFFVARAWWKLYGFPYDPRLWFAFFLHDIGYWGKPNMDGPEGETHPELGARIMGRLFDRDRFGMGDEARYYWHDFCLLHSRHYAKREGRPFSRLCVADKLVMSIEPSWLYLARVRRTGELVEYFDNARKHGRGEVSTASPEDWYRTLSAHLARWAYKHRDGQADDTTVVRHGRKSA